MQRVALALASSSTACAQTPTVVDRVVADVCDEQIVLLGELPSHGEARAFSLKAGVVRRLVDDCGFDALLVEAPVYEFVGFEASVRDGTATPLALDRAIGAFWHTEGLHDWRRWVFERAAAGELAVGGLDDQPSATSSYARETLPALIASELPDGLRATCRAAVHRNLHWGYDDEHPYDADERARLAECTAEAAEAIASAPDVDATRQMMAASLSGFYARQAEQDGAPSREAALDRAARWWTSRLPDGAQVVIWTSTVHAARETGPLSTRPLGARLAETWGDRLAAIGFSAYGGVSSMAGLPARAFADAPSGSLEAHAVQNGAPQAYLDREALRSLGSVPSRLLGGFDVDAFRTADWSALFDGVVVVQEEKAPAQTDWP